MQTVGDRIKALRKVRGIKQNELSKMTGLSQSTLSSLEAGDNSGSRKLVEIAQCLNVSPSYLQFGDQSQRQSANKKTNSIIEAFNADQSCKPYNLNEFADDAGFIDLLLNNNFSQVTIVAPSSAMTCPGFNSIHKGSYIDFLINSEADFKKFAEFKDKIVIAFQPSIEQIIIRKLVIEEGSPMLIPYDTGYITMRADEFNIIGVAVKNWKLLSNP